MPTGNGRTHDKTEIITQYGCRIKFKNNLKPGTKIWIYFDKNMEVFKIEPLYNKYSPEDNPSNHNNEIKDWNGN